MLDFDTLLWGTGALIAIACLVKMTTLRKKHLQGLLREYVERQVLWVRRKMKAAELKNAKKEEGRPGE